jgi:23S rRNA pseudouridine1911/1915/1917 synthase
MQNGLTTSPPEDSALEHKDSTLVSSHGYNYGVKHFYAKNTDTLGRILESTLSFSPIDSEFLLNLGSIYLNGSRLTQNCSLNDMIQEGALLRVHSLPRRHNCQHDWTDRIVFNHADFLVLNKPSGIPSHASVDNVLENSLTQTSLAIGEPLFISHRLDSLTEGLIVYGKNKKFISAFNQLLAQHQIEKRYVALTESGPNFLGRPKNRLIHYMKPDPRAPKQVDHVAHEKWLMCELEILENCPFDAETWFFKLNLLTGRTHQIRAQLSFEGCPIVGDQQYGSKRSLGLGANPRIALKAQEICFTYEGQQHNFCLDEDFNLK